MASLDDFFAKKDKKKSKKKQYKAAGSLLDPTAPPVTDATPAAAVEEVEKPKKGAKGRIAEYNDDSWAESFEEEKVPDFSGLKIATKVVTKEEGDAGEPAPEAEEAAPESDDEAATEATETVDWATGEVRQQEEATPDPMMPNVTGGTYVPPRNRPGGGLRRGSSRQEAPDLGTMSFPTLGAAVADAKTMKERGADEFQQVGPGQGARVSSNPNRYQPPATRGQSNGYAGLDRRGNDGYGRDRW